MMTFWDMTAESSVVDFGDLLARVNGDQRVLKELVSVFSLYAPKLLSQMKVAAARGELDDVKLRAHTMCGMLSTLSCSEAQATAKQIERMSAQRKMNGLPEDVLKLERELRRAYAVLQNACTEIM